MTRFQPWGSDFDDSCSTSRARFLVYMELFPMMDSISDASRFGRVWRPSHARDGMRKETGRSAP